MSSYRTEGHDVQSSFVFLIMGKERTKMKTECLLLKLSPFYFVSVKQYVSITATEFTGILRRKLKHYWE
jgi:hypothetical protein